MLLLRRLSRAQPAQRLRLRNNVVRTCHARRAGSAHMHERALGQPPPPWQGRRQRAKAQPLPLADAPPPREPARGAPRHGIERGSSTPSHSRAHQGGLEPCRCPHHSPFPHTTPADVAARITPCGPCCAVAPNRLGLWRISPLLLSRSRSLSLSLQGPVRLTATPVAPQFLRAASTDASGPPPQEAFLSGTRYASAGGTHPPATEATGCRCQPRRGRPALAPPTCRAAPCRACPHLALLARRPALAARNM